MFMGVLLMSMLLGEYAASGNAAAVVHLAFKSLVVPVAVSVVHLACKSLDLIIAASV